MDNVNERASIVEIYNNGAMIDELKVSEKELTISIYRADADD